MASTKMACAIVSVCGVDTELRIGFPFGEKSARFCKFVWLPGSILKFRIRSVSSIGVGADFREGDEDSNFSIFRVRRFAESPEPLH